MILLLLLLLSLGSTHARTRRHSLIVRNTLTHTLGGGGGDEPEGPFTVVAVSFVVVVGVRRGQTATAAASDALSADGKDAKVDPKVCFTKRAPKNRYAMQPRRFFARDRRRTGRQRCTETKSYRWFSGVSVFTARRSLKNKIIIIFNRMECKHSLDVCRTPGHAREDMRTLVRCY